LYEINNPLYSSITLPRLKRYLFEKLTGSKIWYKELNDFITDFKPDVIHCHFGPLGVMMMNFNQKYHLNVPYVTTIYAYDITSLPLSDQIYRNNLKPLWANGNAFFAEGPALAKKFFSYGCPPEKCLINPLLIPIEEYPTKNSYRNIEDPVKFLFIGRFVEKKGFSILIKAMAQLVDKIPHFTIDVIGSGPLQEENQRLVVDYKLEPYIKWHGLVKHNEIIPKIKDYDFLVHPSLTASDGDDEGGSATIIIEAEAVGLPVITTYHADIPYVMGYDDFIAEENDVESLVQVILKAVNYNGMALCADKGRQKVIEQHNLNSSQIYESHLRAIAAQN
jgi:colanic acid/amylovoran biosynthesis glycosyltransferase